MKYLIALFIALNSFGVTKVKPLYIDTSGFNRQVNPKTDYLSTAGISFQGNDTTLIQGSNAISATIGGIESLYIGSGSISSPQVYSGGLPVLTSASISPTVITATDPISSTSNNISLLYNAANLKVTSHQLNTIQDISSSSSPTFANLIASVSVSAPAVYSAGSPVLTSSSVISATYLGGQLGSYYLDRANHTGTQLASTISDFNEASQDSVGGILTNSSDITLTYNDAANTITAGFFTKNISQFTNDSGYLTSTPTITATNPISFTGNNISLLYNTTNLKLTANQLNTIQDITTASSPTFANVTASTSISSPSATVSNLTINNSGTLQGSSLISRTGGDALYVNVSGDTMTGLLNAVGISNTGNITSSGYISGQNVYASTSVSAPAVFSGGLPVLTSVTAITASDPISITSNNVSLQYNTSNLQVTSHQLNTIQDIGTGASPTFVTVTGSTSISSPLISSNNISNTNNITTTNLSATSILIAGSSAVSITGGDARYVKKSGDTMTGNLTAPNLFASISVSSPTINAQVVKSNLYQAPDGTNIFFDDGTDITVGSTSNPLILSGPTGSFFQNSLFGTDVSGSWTFSSGITATGKITASLGISVTGNISGITDTRIVNLYASNLVSTSTIASNNISNTNNITTKNLFASTSVSAPTVYSGGLPVLTSVATITATDPISFTSNNISLQYNTTNLKLTANQLNTIQDITSGSSPNFVTVIASTSISSPLISSNNISNTKNFTNGGLLTATSGISVTGNITGATDIRATTLSSNSISASVSISSPVFYANDGTLSLPSYTFAKDKDTGIYRSATNSMDLVAGGVAGLEINSGNTIAPLPFTAVSSMTVGTDAFFGSAANSNFTINGEAINFRYNDGTGQSFTVNTQSDASDPVFRISGGGDKPVIEMGDLDFLNNNSYFTINTILASVTSNNNTFYVNTPNASTSIGDAFNGTYNNLADSATGAMFSSNGSGDGQSSLYGVRSSLTMHAQESDVGDGHAIHADVTCNTDRGTCGAGIAVYGDGTASGFDSGYGVWGTGSTIGVFGTSENIAIEGVTTHGTGVTGYAAGSGAVGVRGFASSSTAVPLIAYQTDTGGEIFQALMNGTVRMRIDQNGNMALGNAASTSGGYKLEVSGGPIHTDSHFYAWGGNVWGSSINAGFASGRTSPPGGAAISASGNISATGTMFSKGLSVSAATSLTGSVTVTGPGAILKILSTGTAAIAGTCTLSVGACTVSTTAVTTNTIIILTEQTGSTPAAVYVSARTAGTSFTITSLNIADSSKVGFLMIEP